MYQASQRSIVETKARGTVKSTQTGAAERADAVRVQRKIVQKRRVTGSAEVLGFQRRGGIEAVAANGDTGKSIERAFTNAALGGKKKRKNSVGDRAKTGSGRSRQQTTREGAPPEGGQCSAVRS